MVGGAGEARLSPQSGALSLRAPRVMDTNALFLEIAYGVIILAFAFTIVSRVSSAAKASKASGAKMRRNVRRAVPCRATFRSHWTDYGSGWLKTQAAMGMARIAAHREAARQRHGICALSRDSTHAMYTSFGTRATTGTVAI